MIANSASALVKRVTAPSTTPLLPFVPKWAKVLFLLLIFANSSSFPFSWHIRVWYTPLKAFLTAYFFGRRRFWLQWRQENVKKGGLKDLRVQVWRRALFDDCDYNMHLSNSCYAKNSDAAKMKFAIEALAPTFATGMTMALGASHWKYIKEIPLGAKYLMETRCGGWGDKWMYIVTEFVIYPPARKGGLKATQTPKSEKESIIPNMSNPPSGADTPEGPSLPPKTPEEVVRRLAAASALRARPDGGVVACIALTEYCFKQGRVTVPPRIAMYLAQLSPNPDDREKAIRILKGKDNGRAFARGGWKEEPNADQLGRDIAVGRDGTQSWAEEGRQAMENVDESLKVF